MVYLDHCIRALEQAGRQSPAIEEDPAEGSSLTGTPLASDLGDPNPSRVQTTRYRVLRDTTLAYTIKQLHQDKCQICGFTIPLGEGQTYSEAHHVKPLGKPHNGPDTAANIIVLCPNHHAMLDFGALKLTRKKLLSVEGHEVHDEFLNYHNQEIWRERRQQVGSIDSRRRPDDHRGSDPQRSAPSSKRALKGE
ncbi:MAG TPA: HNH endonuclease [Xanthobacteraceae bacterium]